MGEKVNENDDETGLCLNLSLGICHIFPPQLGEENGDSSPNSSISTLSLKKKSCIDKHEHEHEIAPFSWSGRDKGRGGSGSTKKLRLSKEQSVVLEESFKESCGINPKQKLALAKQLKLSPRQVEVWFQNRRARTKWKQAESEHDYFKKCCEILADENKKLRKEVQELRSLKQSSNIGVNANSLAELIVCKSCEGVAPSSLPSSTSNAVSASSDWIMMVNKCSRPVSLISPSIRYEK